MKQNGAAKVIRLGEKDHINFLHFNRLLYSN